MAGEDFIRMRGTMIVARSVIHFFEYQAPPQVLLVLTKSCICFSGPCFQIVLQDNRDSFHRIGAHESACTLYKIMEPNFYSDQPYKLVNSCEVVGPRVANIVE
jgi:hypothetical protein